MRNFLSPYMLVCVCKCVYVGECVPHPSLALIFLRTYRTGPNIMANHIEPAASMRNSISQMYINKRRCPSTCSYDICLLYTCLWKLYCNWQIVNCVSVFIFFLWRFRNCLTCCGKLLAWLWNYVLGLAAPSTFLISLKTCGCESYTTEWIRFR